MVSCKDPRLIIEPLIRVADPHHFNADPDLAPAFHFNGADPDPTLHFNADPDPDPTITSMRIRIRILLLIKVMRICDH